MFDNLKRRTGRGIGNKRISGNCVTNVRWFINRRAFFVKEMKIVCEVCGGGCD